MLPKTLASWRRIDNLAIDFTTATTKT